MKKTKKIYIPKLRFSEFSKNWLEKSGGDLFENSRVRGEEGLPIYSVTINEGLLPRESLDRKFQNAAADNDNLRAAPGDLVYNMMRMWQGAVGLANVDCMVSPAYVVLAPKHCIDSKFFNFHLSRLRSMYYLWAYSYGLTNDRLRLYYRDFAKIKYVIPD